MTTIEIVNPIATKALGRSSYLSRKELEDEENYIDIGVVVRDADGKPVKNLPVTVTCTPGSDQNKVMKNTGAIYTVRNEDGSKTKMPFYPFSYEFRKPGKHTITFTCDGVSVSVDVVAKPDNRPAKQKPL